MLFDVLREGLVSNINACCSNVNSDDFCHELQIIYALTKSC